LRRKLWIVFQDYKLVENSSVENNILTSLMITHTPKEQAIKKTTQLMLDLGLRQYAQTPVKLLSGWEKQKVSIARALAHDPECLIADEATGNLDREQSKMIADTFIKLNKEGHTVIFITHDIHLINYITDQHTIKLFEMK
jgi:ABC-type ATPase involved in cell division